jgi:topoisomerase IA-like protein
MIYTLLIDSTRGRAGQVVDIDPTDGETIAILTRNGIIGPAVQKVNAPEITKVDAPEIKKRGRPAKAHNASDTAD